MRAYFLNHLQNERKFLLSSSGINSGKAQTAYSDRASAILTICKNSFL